MTKTYQHYASKFVVLATLVMLLAGCQIDSKPKSELDKIRERGVLRVGTLNNQLSYFIGPDGPSGLDYELAREFANQLGVKLEINPIYRVSSLFPALRNNEIDVVAGGQIQTLDRIKNFRPGPAYYYVSQQVVYKKGTLRPKNLDHLIKIEQELLAESNKQKNIFSIVKNSHFQQTLDAVSQENPELTYVLEKNTDVNELLKRVSEGTLRYTMADSVEVSLAQRIYPDISPAFEFTEDQPISWFIRRSDDESLYAMMIEFFGNKKQSGSLASLEEKYIGHIGSFDYVDTRAFIRALDSTLEKWQGLFQKYSDEFDWRLIAALAYQESHWDPVARSPTGVRGLMMLTLPTAKSVGVENRLDPEQSIRGGVAYFRRMIKSVPDSIPEHEKIWFALASYNMGYGHMMDARRLTKNLGGDPDAWSDVKERLPLLRQKEHFSTLKYGYARGDEALSYVENIRRYYQSIIGHIDEIQHGEADNNTDDIAVIPVPAPIYTTSVPNAETEEESSAATDDKESVEKVEDSSEAKTSDTTEKSSEPSNDKEPKKDETEVKDDKKEVESESAEEETKT